MQVQVHRSLSLLALVMSLLSWKDPVLKDGQERLADALVQESPADVDPGEYVIRSDSTGLQ